MLHNKVRKTRVMVLSLLLATTMAFAAAVMITPAPAEAAEECWSFFTGYKCTYSNNCSNGQVCAQYYRDGQPLGMPQCVEECVSSCSPF